MTRLALCDTGTVQAIEVNIHTDRIFRVFVEHSTELDMDVRTDSRS
jgi:hypothetical protein